MRQAPGGRGRSNWGRYQQQQRGGYPPQQPQSYYQAPPPPRPASSGQIQRDVVAFIEGLRANRSNLSTPPNALSFDAVVRAVCTHFRVNEFEELMGTSALQLPALRQLHTVNQRVWTFVTCFMQSRRVNTLFECQQAFLQQEGIRSFHELKVGNSFLHTEAVQSLYYAPVAVMNITTRDVLACLRQFETMLGHDAFRASSHIDLNEFLQFLAQQYRQPSAQAMGVFIDPNGFGIYVGMLRRVANQEMKEMKGLEQQFQREVAEKVFQLTKEKFSTDNRQQALDELLKQTNARSQQQESNSAGPKLRGSKGVMQSLSLDMLKRVTDVDVYLDNVLRRKAAADAKSPNKFRRPISSQEIAETDTKLRNQLTRFLVSSQKSKHHSRLKVVTWVICSIMAKTYALLLSDDKLPDEESGDAEAASSAKDADDGDKEECDCCCVGKETCTCSCSCTCHVESSDEEGGEEDDDKEEKATKAAEGADEIPVKATVGTGPSDNPKSIAKPTTSLEEVTAEIERFLASQPPQDDKFRSTKEVFQVLSSLEAHLTENLAVSSDKSWPGERSMLQLLRDLVNDGENSENAVDMDASGLLGQLLRSQEGKGHGGQSDVVVANSRQSEMVPFIRDCQAVISSSSSLSAMPSDKQQQWIERRVCLEFSCSRVEDLGLGTFEEMMKLANQKPSEDEASILKYASSLDIALNGDMEDAVAPVQSTGESMQVKYLTEEALAKLGECPCLVDVSLFMNWHERYAPLCGPLRSFIRTHEMMLFDHASSSNNFMFVCNSNGTIFRLNEKSTPSDLELMLARVQQAGAAADPSQVAVHLVSMIVTCRGESNYPKQLIEAHLRAYLSYLSTKCLDHSPDKKTERGEAGRFVLEVLMETPIEFAEFVLSLLLGALAQSSSATSDKWSSANTIWKTCRSEHERKALLFVSKRCSQPLWVNETEAWVRRRSSSAAVLGDEDSVQAAGNDVAVPELQVTKEETANDKDESTSASNMDVLNDDDNLASFSTAVATDSAADLSTQHDSDSCRTFIDDLRKKQFGVGLQIQDEATTSVLLIQQQRLERALKRLSDELYSESTHFVLELLQNADDNGYDGAVVPLGQFTLTKDKEIVFYNNEQGFSPANILAICDVGASTKAAVDSESSIGKKGIGFKSVFKVSDNPQVHSNGFHICFHAKNADHGTGMGYILPYWLEDPSHWQTQRGTTFVLPLNDASVPRVEDISQSLLAYEPSVLLFLRRIRELRLRDEIQHTELQFLKKQRELQPNVKVVQLYSRSLEHSEKHTDVKRQDWMVVNDTLTPPPFSGRDRCTEIAVAFPFAVQKDSASDAADRPPLQQVFAYLPLRSYGFRFILQGDFEIPSSREAITNGSEWNEWLVSKFPKLVQAAVGSYIAEVSARAEDDDKIVAAISHLTSMLPIENEVQAPFRRIVPELMRELRQTRWLACASSASKLLTPADLIDCSELSRGDMSESTSTLLEALGGDTLASLFGKHFLHPQLSRQMTPLMKNQLRIEQLHASHLMRILSLSAEKKDIPWTVKMLALLSKLWRKDRHSSLLKQELRLIKCFPLQRTRNSSTRWVSLADAQDSLFVSSQTSATASGKAYEFYGELRILDDDFTAAMKTSSKLSSFLVNEVGIHVMQDHDVIQHHILQKMQTLRADAAESKASEADLQAVLEYGRFLASHLKHCDHCPMQSSIKASMVVLTSTSRLVPVDTSNLFVVGGSTFKSMPHVLPWLVTKVTASDRSDEFAIISTEYCGGDTAVTHDEWQHLLAVVCDLPLLFDAAALAFDGRSLAGMKFVLQWIEEEEDETMKRNVSSSLARYLDKCWIASGDTLGADTSNNAQEQLDANVWRQFKWLEGSDGHFHRSTELWLANDTVRRLFTAAMVTFSAVEWTNETIARDVLGMKDAPSAADVLPVISSLAVDSTMMPSLGISHMVHVYSFLWEESKRSASCRDDIANAFSRKLLLFAPPESNKQTNRFIGAKSAVWSSTAYNGELVALETLYPKTLCKFFTEVCGVQRKPSISFLCEMITDKAKHVANHKSRKSSASEKRKTWKKKLLPILCALSKKVKKRTLSKTESREIRKTLKAAAWLPAQNLFGDSLVFCSSKDQLVQATTEADRKLVKLMASLVKDSTAKFQGDSDVKVLQLEGSYVGDLDALLDLANISSLSSHLVDHASTWCEILARVASNTTHKKKLVKLEQFVVKAWSSSLASLSANTEFKATIQRLPLFPTIGESSQCVRATELYINDQADLPGAELQQANGGAFSVLGLFSWNYFVDTAPDGEVHSDKARVRKFLVDVCGMKSLKEDLVYEVSVLSTQRLASQAFHDKIRALLGLAQRILFHSHRHLYDQLHHDQLAALVSKLQCVLVDGSDGFQVVYRVGNAFSLRQGADELSRCFLDAANCTLYVQSVTGDEEASALSPVLMEVSRKLFGGLVATNVANVLYLSSLQANASAREQWLTETQLLPPLPVEIQTLWLEQTDLADPDPAVDDDSKRKRDSKCLEDGEVEEETPAKKSAAMPYEASTQVPFQGGPTSQSSYPPLPPSNNYGMAQNGLAYGNQPSYPPPRPLHTNTDSASVYPPLPASTSAQGMSSLTLTNAMSKEEREAIGRWGEEYVFNQLKQQHAEEDSNMTVEWVNEKEESGLPYDLTLSSAGKVVEYIEVKSTRTMEKGVFEISMNELDQAAIHGSTYSIYRVFNAGNPALCRVIRMKNPVSLVRQRKIQLALVMQ